MATKKVEFSVPGMACENCANKIRATLTELSGVAEVTPRLSDKHVVVRFDGSQVSERQIGAALGKAGFEAAPA